MIYRNNMAAAKQNSVVAAQCVAMVLLQRSCTDLQHNWGMAGPQTKHLDLPSGSCLRHANGKDLFTVKPNMSQAMT